MNTVIDTSTRIFMAIVGPSGSGKTELILKLLMGNTFYPKFGTVLYLYKEMQPAFSEKVSSREVNVEFMKFDGFESVRKLENVLLVTSIETSIMTRNLLGKRQRVDIEG